MTIIDFNETYYDAWAELFCTYLIEDEEIKFSRSDLMEKLCPEILNQWKQGIIKQRLALEGDAVIGFSEFQIDTEESDWCKRPGWGCIREFCVAKEHRGKGIGTTLARDSEKQLVQMGAKEIYLTSDTAIPFWEKCGYYNTRELCSNDIYILTKSMVK